MKKKCSACNGTHLRAVEGLIYEGSYSDGNAQLRGQAFVCLDCGHIEIYSSDLLEGAKQQEKEEQRIQALYDELDEELKQKEAQIKESEARIVELQKTIKELKKRVANEDISFKEHKLAEEELNEKNEELKVENSKVDQCRYFIDHAYYEIKKRIDEKGHR